MNVLRLGAIVAAAALSACGGGGGDGSPHSTAASTTFPLQAAYQSYAQASQSYSFGLSGTCGGTATAINSPMAPPVAPTANVAFVKTSVVQMKIDSCSTNIPALKGSLPNPGTTVRTIQFQYDANRRPVGIDIPGLGSVGVASGVVIPASVKVGDAGVLATGSLLTVSYSVEADAENTAFLHLNFQGHDSSGAAVTEVQTFHISTGGEFTLLRDETFMQNGFTFALVP
jgi:hypothetical protein